MHHPEPMNWLSDIAILNESDDFTEVGAVSVYRNIYDMCSQLEPWYVAENCGYALNGNGVPIGLTTDGDSVFGDVMFRKAAEPDVLKNWLSATAIALRDTRIYKADKPGWRIFNSTRIGPAERQGILPDSVDGLVAYIGFR